MIYFKKDTSADREITAYDKIAHRSYTFKTSEIASTDPNSGLVCMRPGACRTRMALSRKDVVHINRLLFAYACETPELVALVSLTLDASELFSSAMARIG